MSVDDIGHSTGHVYQVGGGSGAGKSALASTFAETHGALAGLLRVAGIIASGPRTVGDPVYGRDFSPNARSE
jgi:hypothetical protein